MGGLFANPPFNFLAARVWATGARWTATVSGGSIQLSGETAALAGHELLLGIRAEAIGVETSPADGLVRARVVVLEPLGSHNLLTVRCGHDVLKVSLRPDLFPTVDSDVWLRLEPSRIRWMDRETGAAISTGLEVLATETAVVTS